MLEHLSGFIIQIIHSTSYLGIFFLMTLGSALIPIPSEIVLPFTGFLTHSGYFIFPFAVLAAALGDLAGSLIGYGIGYFLEETVILSLIRKFGKFILLTQHDYEIAQKWFSKYGSKIVFVGKLLPGLRYLISLPAGAFKMDLKKFCLYTFLGSLLWCSALVSFGYYVGSKWNTLGPIFRKFELFAVVIFILLVLFYIEHKLKLREKFLKSK